MNASDYLNIRTLDYHYGRLVAIKWIRQHFGIGYQQAKMAHQDITTYQRWTMPWIHPDLNKVCDLPRNWQRIARSA